MISITVPLGVTVSAEVSPTGDSASQSGMPMSMMGGVVAISVMVCIVAVLLVAVLAFALNRKFDRDDHKVRCLYILFQWRLNILSLCLFSLSFLLLLILAHFLQHRDVPSVSPTTQYELDLIRQMRTRRQRTSYDYFPPEESLWACRNLKGNITSINVKWRKGWPNKSLNSYLYLELCSCANFLCHKCE